MNDRPALHLVLALACVACTPKGSDASEDRQTPAASEPTPTPAEPTPVAKPEPEPPPEPEPVAEPTPIPEPEPLPLPTTPAEPSSLHADQGLSVADGSIPSWCHVEAEIDWPIDRGSFEQTIAALLGEVVQRGQLCRDTTLDMSGCSSDGPWWVNHEYKISLIVPLGDDRFGRIPDLSDWSDGTEESALVGSSTVGSSGASIELSIGEERCFDDEDEQLCGLTETGHVEIVVSDLEDGSFLVVRATIDSEDRRVPERRPDSAEVEILGNIAKIEACNGRTHVELPKREQTDEDDDEAGPAISADEAKAAGERCNEGWQKFGSGDLAGAKQDVDAALELLERAVDERGRRSLGACLYNRGRIAEEEDDDSYAIELYQESLAARPNDVVQRRLDKLLK